MTHPIPLGPAELPPVLRMLDVVERSLEQLEVVVTERHDDCLQPQVALEDIMQARMILAGLRGPLSKPEEDELEQRRRLPESGSMRHFGSDRGLA